MLRLSRPRSCKGNAMAMPHLLLQVAEQEVQGQGGQGGQEGGEAPEAQGDDDESRDNESVCLFISDAFQPQRCAFLLV